MTRRSSEEIPRIQTNRHREQPTNRGYPWDDLGVRCPVFKAGEGSEWWNAAFTPCSCQGITATATAMALMPLNDELLSPDFQVVVGINSVLTCSLCLIRDSR